MVKLLLQLYMERHCILASGASKETEICPSTWGRSWMAAIWAPRRAHLMGLIRMFAPFGPPYWYSPRDRPINHHRAIIARCHSLPLEVLPLCSPVTNPTASQRRLFLQVPSSSHGCLLLYRSTRWPAHHAACLLSLHLHWVRQLLQMLLGHRGRAVPSLIKAACNIPHFLVLIPSPPSSTSGTHQFYYRIPPSRLVTRTTSFCFLNSPLKVVKAFRAFPEVFSNMGAVSAFCPPFWEGWTKMLTTGSRIYLF
jgi:hypothetical protein